MKKQVVYKQTPAEYRKSLRNEERLVKLKEAMKPINKILGQIRTDRTRVGKGRK